MLINNINSHSWHSECGIWFNHHINISLYPVTIGRTNIAWNREKNHINIMKYTTIIITIRKKIVRWCTMYHIFTQTHRYNNNNCSVCLSSPYNTLLNEQIIDPSSWQQKCITFINCELTWNICIFSDFNKKI